MMSPCCSAVEETAFFHASSEGIADSGTVSRRALDAEWPRRHLGHGQVQIASPYKQARAPEYGARAFMTGSAVRPGAAAYFL